MGQAISIPITVHSKPSEPAILPVKHSGGFAYEKDRNATQRNTLPGFSWAVQYKNTPTVKLGTTISLGAIINTLVKDWKRKDQQRTKKQKKLFLFYYAQSSYIVALACKKTGIERSTYYRWLENDPGFAESVDSLQVWLNDEMEDALIQRARAGHGPSIRYWLDHRHPDFMNGGIAIPTTVHT